MFLSSASLELGPSMGNGIIATPWSVVVCRPHLYRCALPYKASHAAELAVCRSIQGKRREKSVAEVPHASNTLWHKTKSIVPFPLRKHSYICVQLQQPAAKAA